MNEAIARDSPRILFVDQSGELGGAELFLLDVLSAGAFEGRVVLLRDGPFRLRLEEAGLEVVVLKQQLRSARSSGVGGGLRDAAPSVIAAFRLARYARNCDLIYANTQKAFVVSALASVLAQKPVAWHLHDILTSEHFSGAMRQISVAIANLRASVVIANSEATEASFRRAGGKVQTLVAYNGFDPAPFTKTDGHAMRIELDSDTGGTGPLIGVFGRLAEWKGQHVVLEALSRLPGVRAVFVGGALFGEEPYEKRLRAEIIRLGVGDRVRLLGFRDDVTELMSAVDIVVHSSIAPEPFGRVVVEAMLAARPVIASDAGGVREIVVNRETGILVPPGDPDVLANAIGELTQSPSLAQKLGVAGRRRAAERFSISQAIAGIKRGIDLALRNNPKISLD